MEQFRYKKKYGQNFLCDNNIVKKIVDSSEINNNTLVIEIGPGQGVMSKLIIPRAKYTLLYEIDKELDRYLNSFQGDYKVIYGDFLSSNIKNDILDIDYDKLYVVANLPYYITTPIISKLIFDKILPDRIVVMVQKEVADRFVAAVGTRDYGSFSVLLNYYYSINKLFDVSRNCFNPKPNVDSSVVSMNLKKDRPILKNELFFINLVRDSFQFKRKNIKNNLNKYDLVKIDEILKKYGFSINDRAERLELNIFIEISNSLCD